jgi:hypothetical protein
VSHVKFGAVLPTLGLGFLVPLAQALPHGLWS